MSYDFLFSSLVLEFYIVYALKPDLHASNLDASLVETEYSFRTLSHNLWEYYYGCRVQFAANEKHYSLLPFL